MTTKLCPELMPVLRQLQREGFEVYTYTCSSCPKHEYASLYWFEGGRVLNIQPNISRNERYWRDVFNIGVSYIPSQHNGSGCGLSPRDGIPADELLKHRHKPTWVSGVMNYASMQSFLRNEKVLDFFRLNEKGERA